VDAHDESGARGSRVGGREHGRGRARGAYDLGGRRERREAPPDRRAHLGILRLGIRSERSRHPQAEVGARAGGHALLHPLIGRTRERSLGDHPAPGDETYDHGHARQHPDLSARVGKGRHGTDPRFIGEPGESSGECDRHIQSRRHMTSPALGSGAMRASDLQPIGAGLVGAVTGFASSFALVVAGLQAVGASPADTASGLLMLCVLQGVLAIGLGLWFRMPLSFAWSTPGAAVLVAAEATTGDFRAAVGAFVLCGVLLLVTGLWPALARAVTRIPKPIASAMLAGILFPICIAPVLAAVQLPALGLPVVIVWLLFARLAPRWAVPAAVLATVVVVLASGEGAELAATPLAPVLSVTWPVFDPLVLVSLGLPLYVVTMAGQNVPGFEVLKTFGYPHPPARVVLASTGAAT